MAKVSIIIGSKSDSNLGEKVMKLLEEFDVTYEYQILSAHRSPKELREYIEASEASVFIAIAGLSAALPGFIAAHTLKPVIGVPKDVKLGGLDSLLSIVQMPTGIPVASVGIDNAKNASLLAIEILAIKNEKLREKLEKYRRKPTVRISSPRT
jgi:5-(carboxyamino)imidazole ribonucleotide mutase